MHSVPKQQPAQLDGPQEGGGFTHSPPVQTRPSFWHAWHVIPPNPHSFGSTPAKHVLPTQHPLQVWGLHWVIGSAHAWWVASQVWKPSAVQLSHASPPLPHWLSALPGWHVPVASQHP